MNFFCRFILSILPLIFLQFSCATTDDSPPKKAKNAKFVVSAKGEIAFSEPASESFWTCVWGTTPEWFLGTGLCLVPGYALAPVFGVGYPVWKTWKCYSDRRDGERVHADIKPLISGIRSEAYKELSAVCSKIAVEARAEKEKIKDYTDAAKEQFKSLSEGKIQELKDSCAEGDKTLEELKRQIERIQKGKFEILENQEIRPSDEGGEVRAVTGKNKNGRK